MSIELTITARDTEELHAQLRELLEGTAPAAAAPVVEAKVAAPKAEKPKPAEPKPEPVAEVVAETPAAEPQPEAEASDEIAFPAATGVPTEDELKDEDGFYLTTVKPNVLKVSAKHGRPGVEKLLAEFNVPNASHIPQEQYPALFAAIDKMLEG